MIVTPRSATGTQVVVQAPARLHMGFLDLNGGMGRRFGSLGVALDAFRTRVAIAPSHDFNATGPDAARALRYARALCARLALPPVAIRVEAAIPPHVGLGSGTQLALAIGVGLARLHGLDLEARAVAELTERGARSGIGVGAFEQGGFVLDGGRNPAGGTPPVVLRAEFPDAWRFILVLDAQASGLHGVDELEAFARLPPFPAERAAHLCRLVLMRLLPALIERDLATFGAAVTELQATVGDYFAPAQGGRFANPAVARALAWLGDRGAAALGQSSWGPTGFALFGDPDEAAALVDRLRREPIGRGLRLEAVGACNRGAAVELIERHAGARRGVQR